MGQNNRSANKLEQILGERFGIEILNAMGLAIVVLDPDFNIIEPDSIDWGLRLSSRLQKKLPEIVKAVMSEISNHKITQITK